MFAFKLSSPGIVVARVHADGIPVAAHALIKVLVRKVLVPCQGVCVGERGLQLEGALEGLQGIVMLLQARWWPLIQTPLSRGTREDARASYAWAGEHMLGHMGEHLQAYQGCWPGKLSVAC